MNQFFNFLSYPQTPTAQSFSAYRPLTYHPDNKLVLNWASQRRTGLEYLNMICKALVV